ncbi:MAG: response regulator [Bradymonadaceae bacterium]|nr:response regulator [Lujinxingiaceae bacterium]
MADERQSLGDNQGAICLRGGGAIGALLRARDWSDSELGLPDDWPSELCTAVSICLHSSFPVGVTWGPHHVAFYNEAYSSVLGRLHPMVLGRSIPDVLPSELWERGRPLRERVLRDCVAYGEENRQTIMDRHGYLEETYFSFSHSPILDHTGRAAGIFTVAMETTDFVINERRLRTLRALTLSGRSVAESARLAVDVLGENAHDVAFAAFYGVDGANRRAQLMSTSGLDSGGPNAGGRLSPLQVDLDEQEEVFWPLAQVYDQRESLHIADLEGASGVSDWPRGPWEQSPNQAYVLPVLRSGHEEAMGVLVLGISALRAFDDSYRQFFESVAAQFGSVLSAARALEEERTRSQALAELNQAKTAFFGNVSHEFRTPLTLMLGPLEDLSSGIHGALAEPVASELGMVYRNGLRLLKLVNNLLDLSRVEAGKADAHFVPTELGALTSELASSFRPAIERAGLEFELMCAPLSEPVFVDREMWEKIIFNLLSNAFKYTLHGRIEVRLEERSDTVELLVADSGAGIAAADQALLFERFYRVAGTASRTHEGTGIGLSLVSELIALHGGTIEVDSVEGQGTSFRVRLPKGRDHLPAEAVADAPQASDVSFAAAPFISEAERWSLAATPPAAPLAGRQPSGEDRACVLLVEDNADMRAYIERLLMAHHDVVSSARGDDALELALKGGFDLVLSDVMMLGLDGFELIGALRADERTQALPVILLSARAGEGSQFEGFEAGADDYLFKPFNARELLARVNAHIKLVRSARAAEQRVQIMRAEANAALEQAAILEALHESEERYRLIVDSALDFGIFTTNFDGVITNWNRGAERLLGYGKQEAIGMAAGEIFVPEDRAHDVPRLELETALKTGHSDDERWHLRKDGTRFWASGIVMPLRDNVGEPTGYLKILQDKTAQREQQQAVLASEARFRAVAENAVDIIALVDAHGRVGFISPSIQEVLGISPDAMLGRSLFERVAATERHRVRNDFTRLVHMPNETAAMMFDFERGDGEMRHLSVKARNLLERAGVEAILLNVRDITSKRVVQQELMAARDKAEEMTRLKSILLANMSHEIRTPLTSILGLAEVLANEVGETQKHSVELIARSSQRLAETLNSVLVLAQIEGRAIEPDLDAVDVVSEVEEIAGALMRMAEEKGLTLQVKASRGRVEAQADRVFLDRILTNLIGNAIKFTNVGGVVVEVDGDNEDVTILVRDTGVGIGSTFLPHAFEEFRQESTGLARSHEGSGLGLAITRRLAEALGGTVEISSQKGQGTSVKVTLRAARVSARPSGRQLAARPHVATPTLNRADRLTVLLVEDNDLIRELVTTQLQKRFQVDAFADAESALEFAEAHSFDVALMDISLPGMDGVEALQRLRANDQYSHHPIVAMTGHAMPGDKQRFLKEGFTDYIEKPFAPGDILAVIQAVTHAR